MALDISVFQNALRAPPTVQDYDAANQAYQQNALKIAADKQAQTDAASLRQATMQLGNDPTQNLQTLRQAGLFAPAQAYQKAVFDNQHTQAQTAQEQSMVPLNASKAGEQDALAANHQLDSTIKAHDFAVQQLGSVTDPNGAAAWLHDNSGPGKAFSYDQGAQGYAKLQQSLTQPGGFDAWKQQSLQGGMSATDQLKQQQAAQIAANVQQGENQRAAANISKDYGVANINATTSRGNNAATISKDYGIAGLNQDGSLNSDQQATVDLIGKGQMAAPTGAALRNPRMAAVMDQVGQQYAGQDATHPVFNAGNFQATQQALKSFATGKDGQAIQAGNTTLNHVATLQALMAANNNGDIGAINAAKQRFQQEFGVAAPNNVGAAIAMVGPEITKAVIGAGGGQGDREHIEKVLQAAATGSPAIQAGALNTIQDLFGGRLVEAQRTYQRTTGRTDFSSSLLSPAAQAVLAAKSGAPMAAGGIPAKNAQGWALHQDAQGNKAYVSPDGKQFQAVGQ